MDFIGVVGLMSGTSLDGLDCCFVEFSQQDKSYSYRNLVTKSIPYSAEWKERLKNAFYLNESELNKLDSDFGKFLGEQVNLFLRDENLRDRTQLIASHGHTVFHDPQKGITVQIGSGQELLNVTGIDVINDFRILDVQLGGQGAPLVPVGDHYLFHQYDACLNLGGFSNISFVKNQERIAFDISPCNLPLNRLVQLNYNADYDKDGLFAASGNVIDALLNELNDLEYYKMNYPKSLGYEWLVTDFFPIVEKYPSTNEKDVLRTLVEHIATQIATQLNQNELKNVLITGGGAYNSFLLSRISQLSKTKIIIPEPEIVEFKEALIFAFLGFLNLKNTINTFKSVTGARENSIGGKRYFSH